MNEDKVKYIFSKLLTIQFYSTELWVTNCSQNRGGVGFLVPRHNGHSSTLYTAHFSLDASLLSGSRQETTTSSAISNSQQLWVLWNPSWPQRGWGEGVCIHTVKNMYINTSLMQTHSTWKTMRAAVATTKEPISKIKKKKCRSILVRCYLAASGLYSESGTKGRKSITNNPQPPTHSIFKNSARNKTYSCSLLKCNWMS